MKTLTGYLKNLFRTKDQKIITYLGLMLAVGVLLMLLSGPMFRRQPVRETDRANGTHIESPVHKIPSGYSAEPGSYELALERRLEEILSLVNGAGQVRVMVSITQGRETVFAVDRSINTSTTQEQDAQGGTRYQSSQQGQDKTLIITDRTGVDRPLVVKEIEPVIGGVIIIAEGGDDVLVRDALIRGASTLLGIDINRVQVMRMRGE